MRKISVSNPILTEEERTFLTTDYSSDTNLYVGNNNGFTVSWFAVVGEPGQEKTESKQISSSSGADTIIITADLSYSHSKSTSVYKSQWNQISFEQKVAGGSYAAISGSPFNIEWDNENQETVIFVSDGAATDTYRWRFYNSALNTYSDYSDTLSGTGFTRYTAGYILQEVKKNPFAKDVPDETILGYMNDYQQDLVYPELPKAWWFAKEGTPVSTVADTYKYSISDNWSDLISIQYVLYTYVSGSNSNTYPLTYSPTPEFYSYKADNTQSSDDNAKEWTLYPADSSSDKGYIGIHPTPDTTACSIKPVYYFELTDIDSFGDRLVVPHPKGYIDYCLYRICDDIKSDSTNAEKYNERVKRSITYLKRISRRQLGQKELFRFRGHRGLSQIFGEQGAVSNSTRVENYW